MTIRPETPHREATEPELRSALRALDTDPERVTAASWPGALASLDASGLYSWWTDEEGASSLTSGLGVVVEPGRIYAGQTGATKWPSGKVGTRSLGERIKSDHLGGRVRGSTFRLTLAAALLRSLDLTVEGRKKLAPESEARLSEWIRRHLEVAVHPFPDRGALADLESRVLATLDPPLNLSGRPTTPLRVELTKLRAAVAAPPAIERGSS
jgi:hypothetical protein